MSGIEQTRVAGASDHNGIDFIFVVLPEGAVIDLDGSEMPSTDDYLGGPKAVEVDGNTLVEFTYPVDFDLAE